MKKYQFVSLAVFSILLVFFSLSAVAAGVSRGKSAAPGLIPDELKSMKIEDYFVESKGNSVGSIQNATGHVVVVHKDTNSAYYAATGDAVYQQDVFYTLQDSRCRIKFSTEDIITMGENGKVVAEEIVDDQILKKKSSVISMLKGKAMFYVVRLFRYKTVSASVKTPTAVMGVRGTKFGVEVRKVGEKVADLSDNSFIYLAQNEPGSFETVVYGFEGTVDVTSIADGRTQTVGAGENLVLDNIGSGNVEPTNPATANQFLGATEGGGGGGGGSGSSGGGGTVGGGETGATGDTAAENIAQTLTSLSIEGQDLWPTNRMGYFTAMLTYGYGGLYNKGVFVSDSLQDLNGTDITAGDIIGGSTTMHVDGYNEELTSVTGDGNIITGPYPVSITVLGHNAYMEWGYWTQTTPMLEGPYTYWVDNRGYYIAGDNTPDISALNQVWTYFGGAEGTYWTSTGGNNMTGSFGATVNFGSPSNQITAFSLGVVDLVTGNNVTITGATGSFAGVSSHFAIDGGTGEWKINGVFADKKEGYGSVYGPNAEAMGGVWGVKVPIGDSPAQYATGIFHGTR